MRYGGVITENQLDEWVRANAREAQGVVVELVCRLVAASTPKPRERRFPLGDSIEQPGPDGFLDTDFGFSPFVPEGKSFWEIGTGLNAGEKATSAYRDRTAATPDPIKHESTFVFVSPLSGRRDWQYTWKEDAQAEWVEKRREQKDWRDVRVVDGSRLIDWLHQFPGVELWLAGRMGLPISQIETAEQRWNDLRTIGAPPPLPAQLFLENRAAACAKLGEIFSKTIVQLKLDTRYPDQVVDFVVAYVAALNEEARIDAVGRCLEILTFDE